MSIAGIIDAMSSAQTWLILAHTKPDGDTIGSALALAFTGKCLSKDVVLACPDPCPEKYAFICGGLSFEVRSSLPDDLPAESSIVICVDTSNAERTLVGVASDQIYPVVNIDHHIDNDRYGTFDLVDPTASSTAEVVTKLLLRSGWGISKNAADALYVAMITDNGRFSFASTSAATHRCAAELLKAGASPSTIADSLSASMSKEALLLWGRAFLSLEVFGAGHAAVMRLTEDDFVSSAASPEDTDGLVNCMLMIRGVMFCALAVSRGESTKISLRARAPFSAREVAQVFGGGGHELASGCTIQSEIDSAVDKIKQEMSSQVDLRLSCDR